MGQAIGLTEMGPQILAQGDISPSVNGVTNWATQQKIAQKCHLENLLQIVQYPIMKKITNG